MRLCSIASGSSGNCIYVGSEETHVLVDTGISGKRIEQGLNQLELTGRDIDAILVTHEHSDHIKGLGVLARKHHVPIYGTKETLEEVAANTKLGEYPKELLHPVLPELHPVKRARLQIRQLMQNNLQIMRRKSSKM